MLSDHAKSSGDVAYQGSPEEGSLTLGHLASMRACSELPLTPRSLAVASGPIFILNTGSHRGSVLKIIA